MTDWPVKTLGDVCVLVNGATPDTKVKDYWGGKHAWITPAEMGGLDSPFLSISRRTLSDKGLASCSATLVPPKTVILSSRAPIGHLVINEVPMATNQGCKSLIPKDGLDFSFLYYYLKANVELLESLGTGTTFKELSGTQLKTVEIPMPPLEEQKRIVELLDAATARVTELTTCYEQARTHANNLFTSALRDAFESNLDWPIKRLDNISDVRDGTHDSPRSSESGFPLVTSKNIRQGQISLVGSYLISALDYEQISRRSKVDKFDVLISMIGTVGEVCMVTSEPNFAIKNVGLIKTGNESLSRFLLYFLLSPDGKNQIRNSESGTTQRFIGLGKLRGLEIPVPPLEEQKRIVAQLDLMRAKTSEMVAAYDAKLTAAKNLRQSILEAAFAGDL